MNNDIVLEIGVEKKSRKWFLAIGGVLLLLLIVILLVVMLLKKPRYEKMISVNGYDQLGMAIPNEVREDLGAQMYYLLTRHFELPDDLSEVKAQIRADSLNVINEGIINTVGFLVDIMTFEQSYEVRLSWAKEELLETVSIECTAKSESMFPDGKCYGMTTTSESIRINLPHILELPSGKKVELQYGLTMADGMDIVEVGVNSCGNVAIETSALDYAKSWTRSLGLDPNSIYYELLPSYQNCVIQGE